MYIFSYNCVECLVNSCKTYSYNLKKIVAYFYGFKLIKHVVSLYFMYHDAK